MSERIPYRDPNPLIDWLRREQQSSQPPAQPPTQPPTQPPSGFWPKGYRRHKPVSSWLYQGLWLVICFVLPLAVWNEPAVLIVTVPVTLLSIGWIEYEARCENRAQVRKVFLAIMAVEAAMAVQSHQQNQQAAQQAEQRRRESEQIDTRLAQQSLARENQALRATLEQLAQQQQQRRWQ